MPEPLKIPTSSEIKNKVNVFDIVDNLESDSPTKPLSAKQGKLLNNTIQSHQFVVDWARENGIGIARMPYGMNFMGYEIFDNFYAKIVYGNGIYLAVGESCFTTSTDGVNWSDFVELPFRVRCTKGVYGDGKFAFLCLNRETDAPIILYTEDCVSWSHTILPTYDFEYIDIVYGNGIFAILLERVGANNPPVLYSTNCVSWQSSDNFTFYGMTDLEEEGSYSVDYPHVILPSLFIAYGDNGFTVPCLDAIRTYDVPGDESVIKYAITSLHSNDCKTWTTSTYIGTISRETFEEGAGWFIPRCSAFGNNKYITIVSGGACFMSDDGINWYLSSTLLPSPIEWFDVIYDTKPKMFVALGRHRDEYTQCVAVSSDGIDWSVIGNIDMSVADYRWIVAGGPNIICQRDGDGAIAFSNDYVKWNTVNPTLRMYYYAPNCLEEFQMASGITKLQKQIEEKDQTIANLQNEVDELQKTVTEQNGKITFGNWIQNTEGLNFRKTSNKVEAFANINLAGKIIGFSGYTICRISAGYEPPHTIYGSGTIVGTANKIYSTSVEITPDGYVKLYNGSYDAEVYGVNISFEYSLA